MRTFTDSQDPGHAHVSVVKWSVSRAGKPPALNLQHWRKTHPSWPPFKEETAGAWVHFTVKKKKNTGKSPAMRHFSCTLLIPKTKCFIAKVCQNKPACNSPHQWEALWPGKKEVCELGLIAQCRLGHLGQVPAML